MPPTASGVWAHLTKLREKGSGNVPAKCKACDHEATTNPAAWWEHLTLCSKVVAAVRKQAQDQVDKAARQKRDKQDRQQIRDAVNGSNGQAKVDSEGRGGLKRAAAASADQAIAEFFFANGLPPRLADDYFFKGMLKAVKVADANYKSPPRQRLSTDLLSRAKKRAKLEQDRVIKLGVELTGATLVSDGWSDMNRRPLINVLEVTPKGEFFHQSIDTSGDKKTMEYIAEKVGKHVTQDTDFVVMDGACKGAIEKLMQQFAWLSGVVCSTHGLELFMKDIGKQPFAEVVLDRVKAIVKFINGHHKTNTMFDKLSSKRLLLPAATRFSYHFIMIERVLECEDALRSLVVSREYEDWMRSSSAELRDEARCVQ